jgi:hypothetical protein
MRRTATLHGKQFVKFVRSRQQPHTSLPQATLFVSEEFLAAPYLQGLTPLHGRIVFNSKPEENFFVVVEVGSRRADFSFAATECAPLGRHKYYFDYQLVVNTFLLANGEQMFNVYMPETQQKAGVQHRVQVKNDSVLAQRTKKVIENYPAHRWLWREGEIDSTHFPFTDDTVTPWFDREDALSRADAIAGSKQLDAGQLAALKQFVTDGYCILPRRLDENLIKTLDDDLAAMLRRGEIDLKDSGDHRIELVHQKSRTAREIWTLPFILKFLGTIFGEDVLPCQTLVFLRGTGQAVHQDTIHLTAFPAGYMCGVWIALEDIQEDAGPLFVYPGSHRLPRLYKETVSMARVADGDWSEYAQKYLPRLENDVVAGEYPYTTYLPKRGDILVWHENLAHGGSYRANMALSRKSIVSHYFCRGTAVWYDSTGTCARLTDPSIPAR